MIKLASTDKARLDFSWITLYISLFAHFHELPLSGRYVLSNIYQETDRPTIPIAVYIIIDFRHL